jgi:cytochrome c peroxidase
MNTARPIPLLLTAILSTTSCGGGGGGGTADLVATLRNEIAQDGIQPLPDPPAIPDELFELGRMLFFDKILSGNEDVSCATCHWPEFATADARTLSRGVGGTGLGPDRNDGILIPRNSPALFHMHLFSRFFWDGRVERDGGDLGTPAGPALTAEIRAAMRPELELLAAQALLPLENREEMRGQLGENVIANVADGDFPRVWDALVERVVIVPAYAQLLLDAYPTTALVDLNIGHVGNAIAAFLVRAFAQVDSPFERFVRGDDGALTTAELQGASEFFGPGGCDRCHAGQLFSDMRHRNIGLPQLGPGKGMGPSLREDFGRELVTGLSSDRYQFRTPSLLNVALTAPYGHAGQFAQLTDFVRHYRDTELSNLQYDIASNTSDPDLVTTLVPNGAEIRARIDFRVRNPRTFDEDSIVNFLEALTAESARSLMDLVPPSVPSGLPVE